MASRLPNRLPLAVMALSLWALPAQAFRLVPIEMEFTASGRGATQIFRVENDRSEPEAIELRLMARQIDAEGNDALTDAADRFIVYPEQVVLQPGQSQSVRVQWTGEPNPARELAFRLVAEQLPVDIGKAPTKGGQVRLLVRYVASVYVKPSEVKQSLAVTSAAARATPEGKRLEVTVRNDGTVHQILRDPVLTLGTGGKTLDLKGDQLQGLTGGNILAGGIRRFLVPWPAGLPEGPLSATLSQPGR